MKIALIGGTKINHGMVFGEMFNGYDQKLALECKWGPQYPDRVGGEARITHVWDENPDHARESARICGIPQVVEKKEEVIGRVDAVIIVDDCTMQHQKKAIPFLRAGIPCFIDKPLSADLKEAEDIVALARKHKALLMSCSALRFARETQALREGKDSIGDILTGFSVCKEGMGDLVFYGIHAVELLFSVVGHEIQSVKNVGKAKEDMLVLDYRDGRRFVVTAYENISGAFQLALYGTKGNRFIKVEDSGYFYSEMLRQFVKMVETGKEVVPLEDTLAGIETVVRGKAVG
ncbi:MAG: Gfo/Idh/MocA family oxidoreductase [Verrucomicrobiae bacterium]|nr:Gfo/Idh/MocA family oxidoreductase [Verrucomicrobiae bacterium]